MRVFAEATGLAEAAARAFAECARAAVARRGRFLVVLAGGQTPLLLYRRLAELHRSDVPWAQAHVLWGDERCVPPDHPASNYGAARAALLEQVPIPPGRVHPIPADLPDPERAAESYEATLRELVGADDSSFDLVLLGLGPDGHVASLFPGAPSLDERERWVVAVASPKPPPCRVTLTVPALARARNVFFLVTGASKAGAVRATLEGPYDPGRWPGQRVRPPGGSVTWWLDREAASELSSPGRGFALG